MDNLDRQIINILLKNGRITHEEISKRLNMSRPAIHQRISKLEQQGIIEGYRTKIDWNKLGFHISAYVYIKSVTNDLDKLMHDISDIKVDNVFVEECHRVTDKYNVIIKIRTITPEYITKFQDVLLKNEEIKEISTSLLLSSID